MTIKYQVQNEQGVAICSYTAERGAKFSSALDMIKHYKRNGVDVKVQDEYGEIITREECEYILK